jgi:hypothetical protein
MDFMENYILNLKASNSYLKKFEIAKFNLSLLSKDSIPTTALNSLPLRSENRSKRNNLR